MFNNVKVFKRELTINGDSVTDYCLEIGSKFYPCSFYCVDVMSPDLNKYDVVLSTSSLDKLEVFILNLYKKQDRSYIEDNLLEFLYYYWDSYTRKLSNELFALICTFRDEDEEL